MGATIFDLLTGVKIGDVKTESFDGANSRTYVDTASIEFWNPIILLSRVLDATRTYAHGLSIPEQGAIWTQALAPSADVDVRPSGTEIWMVENIDLDNCTAEFNDGTSKSAIQFLSPTGAGRGWLVTNTLYLTFTNASGAPLNPSVAYSKVGL